MKAGKVRNPCLSNVGVVAGVENDEEDVDEEQIRLSEGWVKAAGAIGGQLRKTQEGWEWKCAICDFVSIQATRDKVLRGAGGHKGAHGRGQVKGIKEREEEAERERQRKLVDEKQQSKLLQENDVIEQKRREEQKKLKAEAHANPEELFRKGLEGGAIGGDFKRTEDGQFQWECAKCDFIRVHPICEMVLRSAGGHKSVHVRRDAGMLDGKFAKRRKSDS